jgi:hypothetical protein
MWMDDALMVAPFSSLLVPRLNQGGELKSTFFFSFPQSKLVFVGEHFFFLNPTLTLTQVLPTYLQLDYLPMHPGLLPPSPPNHPYVYFPIYLPTYVPTH